jgi:GT2 family glycosyltransferase
MCEGELDYDFSTYTAKFIRTMHSAKRRGVASGVCFMVHRQVFNSIGLFDDDPKLGGYEDDEFFRRARRFRFRLATTGRAFIHHFGSVTQKSIKAARKMPKKELGNREEYRCKTGQTWIKRKITQVRTGVRGVWWKKTELWRFGRTLHEKRFGGRWKFF